MSTAKAVERLNGDHRPKLEVVRRDSEPQVEKRERIARVAGRVSLMEDPHPETMENLLRDAANKRLELEKEDEEIRVEVYAASYISGLNRRIREHAERGINEVLLVDVAYGFDGSIVEQAMAAAALYFQNLEFKAHSYHRRYYPGPADIDRKIVPEKVHFLSATWH